jgi:hypothetical protein
LTRREYVPRAEDGFQNRNDVDPDKRRVECHRLSEGAFRPLIDAEGEKELAHPDWGGLVIDLAALWR